MRLAPPKPPMDRRARVTAIVHVNRPKKEREREMRLAAAPDVRDVKVGASTGRQPQLVAREVMRVLPRSVAPGDSLARAARLMASFGTRELPVVDGRALVGILTRTDMEPYRGHYEWTAVRSAMTADPVTVLPEAPIGEVSSLLLDRGFNSVPVSADGELLGMIRRTDVLRALAPTS
jgi:CBS domain-containing protein